MTPLTDAEPEDRPEQSLAMAERLLGAGRTNEAEAILCAAVNRFPGHDWVATAYGHVLNRQGRWSEAADEWRRQIDRFPDHVPAYAGLATSLAESGRGSEAYHLLSKAVSRWPDVYWLRLQHAHLSYQVRNELADAIAHWERVAADFPDESHPHVERARAARAAGYPAGAWEGLQPALRKWPEEPSLLVAGLENLLDLLQVELALDLWRRLQRLHPEVGAVTPYDQSWRLFLALDGHSARPEPRAYLLSEPHAGSPDWRPVIVERILVLTFGELAVRTRRDIRSFLRDHVAPADRTLLHRMVWSLVGGEIGEAEAAENLCDALERDAWTMQVLLETWSHPTRNPAYAKAAREVLPRAVKAELNAPAPRYPAVLQALKIASVFDPATFATLRAECADHFVRAPGPAPGSPASAVASLVHTHGQSRPHRRIPARLRIAVCVSGQMRGYRDAFATWGQLGLDVHEAHYFVHTWRKVGGKPPELTHAYRTFGPRFACAYIEVVTQLGLGELKRRYPRLLQRAEAVDDSDVDPQELAALYGAAEVRIDDEAAPAFVGRSNFWKMHYKIREAHQLALASGSDFDLFVRTRPDRAVKSVSGLDWRLIAERCAAEDLVYADEGRSVQSLVGYYMGDQFAVGARPAMNAYAGVFDFVEAGGMFGVPAEHVPHASLALATLHTGVRVEAVPHIAFGEHMNTSRIADSEVESLLWADIGSRRLDEFDTALLQGAASRAGPGAAADLRASAHPA